MPFHLLPLQTEDASRCADIYFSSFQNPHSLACWPRVPAIHAFWTNMIRTELDEPGAHWLKAVDEGTGEVASFVKWVEPKPGVEPSGDLPEWPAEADVALCDETFGAWAQRHRQLMGTRGHWYLEIVATDPTYQGKGAGSMLMRWGLQRADQQNVESYLEASPDAVPLYKKLGFQEADGLDTFIKNERVDGVWYRNLFMIRPAQNAGGQGR